MSNINTNNNTTEATIQVALRIRPPFAEELVHIPSQLQKSVISATPFTPNQVVVQSEKKKSFTFDHVFGPKSTQKEIYDKTVTNLIDQFLEGNNVTILAFGHALSGKTFTIGTDNSLNQESKGIIPRAMTTLLSYVNSTQYKSRKFFMRVSFVEIYDDELIDLLCERNDKKASAVSTGLQEIRVNSPEEVMGLLSLGQLNRRANIQDPDQNDLNKNSHLIFTVTLSQQKFVPANGPSANSSNTPPTTPNKIFSPVTVTSKFHFVDLAGNEMEKGNFGLEYKLKEHLTSTNEATTKVAIGNAICALRKFDDPLQSTTFLPYKDNKLTKILHNYLCNNHKILIMACVSQIEYNIKETINTLEYAKHARNIEYTSHKIIYKEEEEEEGWDSLEHLRNLVLKLRSEIKALKNTLAFYNDLDSDSISSSSSSAHNADISRQSSLSPPNSEKEINLLEDRFVILKRSFNDLSKEFSKSEISDIVSEENAGILMTDRDISSSGEDTDNTIVQDDNSSSSSNESSKLNDKKNFIQNVWPSFQKAVGPIIQEYEKSISSLENQLSLVRAALSHSESKMQIQERKLNEAEDYNGQNKNIISNLKHEISKLYERGETTENYIKDLETKLDSDTCERKKDQTIINDLRSRLEKLSSNEESAESRLEESEIKNSKMSKIENKYLALTEQFEKQKNVDKEEKKRLLKDIRIRDDKILKLEKNVENLINEIEKIRQIEVTPHQRSNHSKTSFTSSILNVDSRDSISSVSTFDSQLDNLLTEHEKMLEELNDTRNKHQTCLVELEELRSQRTDMQSAKPVANSTNEGLDQVDIKQEFANLQINYHKTLEVVEKLREEIKRRDSLAQLEVVSEKDSVEVTTEEQSIISAHNATELTAELEKAKAVESERLIFIKELEAELKEKSNDINELQEAINLSSAEIMKLQESETKHIELVNKLERELQGIKGQQVKEIPDVKKDQYSGTKKFTVDKFTNSNELLRENNDSLIAEIIELEARATILSQNENLQDEITKRNSCDTDSLAEMKVKIKKLQAVKDELESTNETFAERCGELEEKVQSLTKQLWTLGNDGNAMALQVADLNNQIMNREKEIDTLKQKSTASHKKLESEILQLLNENKSLNEKIKDLSMQTSKEVGAEESSSDKDDTIIQQNDLIKNLQEQILELEQLLDESCRNTSKTEDSTELLAEIERLNRKLAKTESDNLKNIQLVETLEITFDENETQLQKTKEDLNSVLSQRQDLLKYINELKSELDEVKNEIESAKTTIETQGIALDEEREAKEKSEIVRIALENQVEQLMTSRKHRFMCF